MDNCGKKISIVHLYYTIAIALLIILGLILVIPDKISSVAFENFSFAATLVSIVLAVVSIVYAIQSGGESLKNMTGVQQIESSIEEQLHKLSNLEESITRNVKSIVADETSGIRSGLNNLESKVDNLSSPDFYTNSASHTHREDNASESKFNHRTNSIAGEITLYIVAKSYDTKMNILPLIRDELSNYYYYGYFIALRSVIPDKISTSGCSKDEIIISNYDASYFGNIESIKSNINSRKDGASENTVSNIEETMSQIDRYFENSGDSIK